MYYTVQDEQCDMCVSMHNYAPFMSMYFLNTFIGCIIIDVLLLFHYIIIIIFYFLIYHIYLRACLNMLDIIYSTCVLIAYYIFSI